MVVSAAFAELAEILACLDRSDVATEDISVVEESVQGSDEITADLTVAVSLFDDAEFPDGVSITHSDGVDLLEEDVTVDLTVTVPDSADLRDSLHSNAVSVASTSTPSSSSDTPAYKDPEALETVYERYDSFPQMTEALDVDVTPETVRRHAIKYGIHDAGEDTASAESSGTVEANAAEVDVAEADPAEVDAAEADTDEVDAVEADSAEETVDVPSDEVAGGEKSTDADASEVPAGDVDDGGSPDPNLSDRHVADLLTTTDTVTDADRPIADGNGIPPDLTVGQLASALEASRTVYEVTQRLDASYETVRGLLEELDLLPFVNGRLASTEGKVVTPADVCCQMGVDDAAIPVGD